MLVLTLETIFLFSFSSVGIISVCRPHPQLRILFTWEEKLSVFMAIRQCWSTPGVIFQRGGVEFSVSILQEFGFATV